MVVFEVVWFISVALHFCVVSGESVRSMFMILWWISVNLLVVWSSYAIGVKGWSDGYV